MFGCRRRWLAGSAQGFRYGQVDLYRAIAGLRVSVAAAGRGRREHWLDYIHLLISGLRLQDRFKRCVAEREHIRFVMTRTRDRRRSAVEPPSAKQFSGQAGAITSAFRLSLQ
jgi:hypothetical protein